MGQLPEWDPGPLGNWLDAIARAPGPRIAKIGIAGIVSRGYCSDMDSCQTAFPSNGVWETWPRPSWDLSSGVFMPVGLPLFELELFTWWILRTITALYKNSLLYGKHRFQSLVRNERIRKLSCSPKRSNFSLPWKPLSSETEHGSQLPRNGNHSG